MVDNNDQINAISIGALARELLEMCIMRLIFRTTLSVESASEIADLSKAIPGIETLVLSRTHMREGGVHWQSHQTSSNTKGATWITI